MAAVLVLQAVACSAEARPPSEVMAAEVVVVKPYAQQVDGMEAAVRGVVEVSGESLITQY